MFDPFLRRVAVPRVIQRAIANKESGPLSARLGLCVLLQIKRQVPVNRRITGDVAPEEIRVRQRRIQYKLPTDS